MSEHTIVVFGFGPIASGLFAKEAFDSGNFSRIVVAEIDTALVGAVTANAGSYNVNIASSDGIEQVKIDGVEIFNPNNPQGKQELIEALKDTTEIVTSLPSVNFFDADDNSVASLIAEGLESTNAPATIIYTAENNNHAAEILEEKVRAINPSISNERTQFLNTVIGKMSQVVTDADEIEKRNLLSIAPGIGRAFLVEQFNRILVTRTTIEGFRPGIEVFIEKDDLLPFEEAKLYGHNAIHALLGFLASVKGYAGMSELADDGELMQIARRAFIDESGKALIQKYTSLGDELFTEAGYKEYAEDLLERMTNRYLADSVARTSRDIVRKLCPSDRIFGTIRLALEYGIAPANMSLGAAAGIATLLIHAEEYNLPEELRCDWRRLDARQISEIFEWLWGGERFSDDNALIGLTCSAMEKLESLMI